MCYHRGGPQCAKNGEKECNIANNQMVFHEISQRFNVFWSIARFITSAKVSIALLTFYHNNFLICSCSKAVESRLECRVL